MGVGLVVWFLAALLVVVAVAEKYASRREKWPEKAAGWG